MTDKSWCIALTQLIASWWKVDRIRISTDEGMWLSLPIGSFVERDGDLFEVVDREDSVASDESLVGYRCVASSQSARLLVTSGFATYSLTGDLSPWRTIAPTEEPRIERCIERERLSKPYYRLYWEDRAGVRLINPGELTLWPKGRRK